MWKTLIIKGEESIYSINELGDVYSNLKDRLLIPKKLKSGYMFYILSHKGEVFQKYIHRLVFQHFSSEKYNDNTDIGHIDKDYSNNNIENLEVKIYKERKTPNKRKEFTIIKKNYLGEILGEYKNMKSAGHYNDMSYRKIFQMVKYNKKRRQYGVKKVNGLYELYEIDKGLILTGKRREVLKYMGVKDFKCSRLWFRDYYEMKIKE